MRRLLCALALFSVAGLGQMQHMPILGFPSGSLSATTITLNGAASGGYSQNWMRVSYIPTASFTLSKVKFRVSAVNGTLGANDLVCDIYSDSSGAPGSSLQSTTTVTSTPAGAAWVEFTGFWQALTAYTQYWFVLRNANATPTSNYPTYFVLTNAPSSFAAGPLAPAGSSTNSGSTWAQVGSSVMAFRVETSLGAFYGYPIETQTAGTLVPSNFRIFSDRQSGALFTTQSGADLSLKACGFAVTKNSSPTGNLSCRIYSGNSGTLTTVATSDSSYAPAGFDITGRWTLFYFTTPVTLSANTLYRVVLIESPQSDTSSNYYAPNAWQVDSNANSLALLPLGGTIRGTYCTSSCTTAANWTTDATNIPTVGLLLNPSAPIVGSGGGGGQRVNGSVR